MAVDEGRDLLSSTSAELETALGELEGIVRQLETGDVELEKSIAIYERGAALRAHCEGRLKSAELKVEQIVQGASGPATEHAAFD